ncbi:MAG: helix-turn-helix transcriptional regulator [Dehalococcoidia bacterium]
MARGNRTIDQAFGEVLKRLRKRAGLSQEELAHRCDLHRTYVSMLERGLKSPSLGVVVRLAEELGVDAWEMVKEVGKS